MPELDTSNLTPQQMMLLMMYMQQQQSQQQQQGRGNQFLNQAVQNYTQRQLMGPSTTSGAGGSAALGSAGVTTLGGANTMASIPGISGASVSGGSAGAGLGGAGAGGMAAMGPAAAFALPLVGMMLDSKNVGYQNRAMQDIASGDAMKAPMGLNLSRQHGATFAGGDPNALDRAIEFAASRGLNAKRINPMLASFGANADNIKTHLDFVAQQPDRFAGEENRATARAAENARDQGYNVTQQNVSNNMGGVRHAFENIERRRLQGGR